VSVRVKEIDFSCSPKANLETPGKISFSLYPHLSVSFRHSFTRNIIHVSWRYCARQMHLIKGVEAQTELLQVDDLNFYMLIRGNISDFEVENVFALGVEFSVSSLFSHFNSLFVLLFGLLLLFDNSFNACVTELSYKSVNTCVRADGKAVLQFQELISRIVISLNKSNIDHSINNFHIVFTCPERHQNSFFRA